MKEQYITIKEYALNNHCPECFSKNGLHLLFKQRFIDSRFYKSVTSETIFEMNCKTCETTIYPSRWTDDIERVVAYQQKAFSPKKTSFKLKRIAWILLFAFLILVTALVATIVLL
ncbi:MAG TPA: hypothetical protein VFF15_01530 [Flavobacteriaceae bacterium]|nr:hypothetical protein [Flavobacteriaceae bacterium]